MQQPVEDVRVDVARPGPDADGIERRRIDVEENRIARSAARREREAPIAQGIVERGEPAQYRRGTDRGRPGIAG